MFDTVAVSATLRCAGCAVGGNLTIEIRPGSPSDCTGALGVTYEDINLDQVSKFYDTDGPCLGSDQIGTAAGGRVKGSFDGVLHPNRLDDTTTVQAKLNFDVTLD
jgi:hypothetical protein